MLLLSFVWNDGGCSDPVPHHGPQPVSGYLWQAIREDEEAARAVDIDTSVTNCSPSLSSAAMTSLAGVFFAFYYDDLFPEEVFRSIGGSN